ncbi:hypothetical protein QQ008_20095 [Fulvivirgaceae bacterium BMA10]|uniref:ABM domain-containing protein n=1 Tax=Splendidivirga corallicola TaxID=3051826 RepID=A0ABT8KUR7_9BACT|nr:hypothetical protein [Fulvivirgaceae bacterium BMA10]
MKAVRVQYTVKDSYVATNKQNIEQVMSDLRALNNPNIRYSSFLLDDGKTFMHFALYPDEATGKIVSDLPSFQKFRSELKESQPEIPPKAENLSLVASAYEFFGN